MAIYLDYNASTPIDPRVLEVMMHVYKEVHGNADSRTHHYGEHARKVIEHARVTAANLLKVARDEVFFTSGATESNNIAILGLQQYALQANKRHIITTAMEHKSVLEPLKNLEQHGYEVTYIKPDPSGRINVKELLEQVRKDTLLVSVMHANNETGIIQPVKEIGNALAKQEVLFHIDAAQSFGKLVDELREIHYDLLSASAHKMYGPQGIGVLVLRKKRYKLPPVKSIMFGGNQEHGIRPGTLPTALIAGFGEACSIAQNDYSTNCNLYYKAKCRLLDAFEACKINYKLNGSEDHCMPNTINISFTGINSEALMLASRPYCAISNGSACNSQVYKPSYVLEAMGLDCDRIQSSVRISWGIDVNMDEIENMIAVLQSFY